MTKNISTFSLITVLSTLAFAQPTKTQQLSNNSAAVLKAQNTVTAKTFEMDKEALSQLKFRLSQKRDIQQFLATLGPGSTGGGDSCFQRLVTNYMRLVTGFRMGVLFNPGAENSATLLDVLGKIEIQMDKNLKKKGHPVEALNVPTHKLVIVDQKVCASVDHVDFDRRMMGLLLHEAYGIAKIPDKKYQESSKLLSQISEFSVSLSNDEEAWLVMEELMAQFNDKNSSVAKLLTPDPESLHGSENINFNGIKIIRAGEEVSGRFDDSNETYCAAYAGQECGYNWRNVTGYYIVIITKSFGGSGWSSVNPFVLKFEVNSSSRSLNIGGTSPENAKLVKLPSEPVKATFVGVLKD